MYRTFSESGVYEAGEVHASYPCNTPLHAAAASGHAEIVQYLLLQGASAKKTEDNGMTPLHLAARWGHLDATKALLAAADVAPKRRNHAKQNAADLAKAHGHGEVHAAILAAIG